MSYRKAMKSGNALNVKKGSWDSEEDNLLRECINKYGEGKWHLVPQRAGLNRCRKSCRLRWLNYLSPAIKRGEFSDDEVDLITRLHKLLGNRWSLIGGRLPGRTANDVKNYWNTNIQKKLTTACDQKGVVIREEGKQQSKIAATGTGATATTVIKPLSRTLSKGTRLPCYNLNPKKHMSFDLTNETLHNNKNNNNNRMPSSPATVSLNGIGIETLPPDDDGMEWWENLFAEINILGKEQDSSEGLLMGSSSGFENLDAERNLIWKKDESAPAKEPPEDNWSDIWDLLDSSDNN